MYGLLEVDLRIFQNLKFIAAINAVCGDTVARCKAKKKIAFVSAKASSARRLSDLLSSVVCLLARPPDESSGVSLSTCATKKQAPFGTCFLLAGVKWFEHPNDGVRVRCLTAWRHPNAIYPDIIAKFQPNIKRFSCLFDKFFYFFRHRLPRAGCPFPVVRTGLL